MGLSIETDVYTGGPQTFPITFALGFINRDDVRVRVEGEVDGGGQPVYRAFTWNSDAEILVTDPITVGLKVTRERTVSKTELEVDFTQPGTATRENINTAIAQAMMAVHEFTDGRLEGEGFTLAEVYQQVLDTQTAVETSETNAANSATAAATSAANAANSATAAATSETNAANSATAAATSETNAGNSATAAATSETNAGNSATAAATSETNAATSETNAGNSATASAASAAAALTSETNAAASETAAALSAAEATTAAGVDLGAIAAVKAETAVDVLVYDTSQDSDGGAWRERMQHTSWYNEAASATRGSRKTFPAIAVIVLETSKLTIYDGDDPSLPMWMVFNAGVDYFIYDNPALSSVSCLNGLLSVGDRTFDLYTADFSADRMKRYLNSSTQTWSGGLADRNSPMVAITVSGGIINRTVNDVAMIVLPDAPADPATGLQIPTIAVATEGGVSVISAAGSVSDSAQAFAFDAVAFRPDGSLVYRRDGSPEVYSADDYSSDGFGVRIYDFDLAPYAFLLGSSGAGLSANGGHLAVGRNVGLEIYSEDLSTPANGMVAYIAHDYATGWMPGDIKGAWLSDTETGSLVGSELVTNGDFSTDSDWTKDTQSNGSVAISGGVLTVTSNGGTGYPGAYQSFATVIGETYTISADFSNNTTGVWIRKSDGAGTTGSGNVVTFTSNDTTASGSVIGSFVATSTTTYLSLFAEQANAGSADFDNVSCRLAVPDRSVNNNGLQTFGTVSRTAVATGAELAAYSGFSASNYLEQPYNADLDFGTGDFCIMGWMWQPAIVSSQMVDRGNADRVSGNGRITLLVNTGGSVGYQFFTRDGVGTGRSVSVGALPQTNTWYHVCGVRTGGFQRLYVNGVEVGTAVANTADLSNAAANLYVGQAWDGSNSNNGNLSLLRISATAPSDDQIAKIYNDERHLFQENAAATLFGTSDAVTAVAADPVTGLRHAGTSAGRSVFSGLRRVENTTDAVGAAISASQDYVVDE